MSHSRILGRSRLLLIVALLTAVLAPVPASANFGAPINISPRFALPWRDYSHPNSTVAIAPDGDAVILWETDWVIRARTLSAAGSLGPVLSITEFGSTPLVAVDGKGNATFAWSHPILEQAQARRLSAAGVLGRVINLTPSSYAAGAMQIGLDANGNAVFALGVLGEDYVRLMARTLSATGALGPLREVARVTGGSSAPNSVMGVDSRGNSVFTWLHYDGTFTRARARTLSAAGVLGPIKVISRPGENVVDTLKVVTARNGNSVFVWAGQSPGKYPRIESRTWSSAGVFGPTRLLTLPEWYVMYPDVGIDADGDAVFCWQNQNADIVIQARRLTKTGVLGSVLTLSPSGKLGLSCKVAMNASGHAVLTWEQRDGSGYQRANAQTLSATGVLGPVQPISPSGEKSAFAPLAAINGLGNAVAVWNEAFIDSLNRNVWQIRAARGP